MSIKGPKPSHGPGLSLKLPPKQPALSPALAKLCKGIVVGIKKQIVKEKGDPRNVALLSEERGPSDVREWIRTGIPELDRVLGGGLAVGRMSEWYGPEASGKTAATDIAARYCQLMGGIVIRVDMEHSWDARKAEQYKIRGETYIHFEPDDLEEGWNRLFQVLDELDKAKPDCVVLIIWDSIAFSTPRAEIEEDNHADAHVGLRARLMEKGYRKVKRRLVRLRAHFMAVNQEREDIKNKNPFKEYATPGGRGAKYFAAQRVRLARMKTFKKGDKDATGILVKAVTKKNKLFPPGRTANFVIDFTLGVSPELSVYEHLVELRHIKASSGKYMMTGDPHKFTRDEFVQLMQNKEFAEKAIALSLTAPIKKEAVEIDDEPDESE